MQWAPVGFVTQRFVVCNQVSRSRRSLNKMVCPMCISAIVSQAAVPVASAVGGAIAAKAAVGDKQRNSQKVISAKLVKRAPTKPVLQTIDADNLVGVKAARHSRKKDDSRP